MTGIAPEKIICALFDPVQIVWVDGIAIAFGVGFTNTVAVIGNPLHPLTTGVIVNVTVIGILVVFVSVPEISPAPVAGIPVTVATLSLTQLNTVPATEPESTIVVIATPEHLVCDDGAAVALGVGFTVTIAAIAAPGQPFAIGVIVKVTVTGAAVVLLSVPLILPAPPPLAGIPVTVPTLSLTQLKVVLATLPFRTIVVNGALLQIVCDEGVATAFGVGFTSTVAIIGVPLQVTPAFVNVGVIVKVTVSGIFVVFVNVAPIFPEPDAGMPVTVATLSLIQLNTVPATVPVSTMVVSDEPEHIVCDDGVAASLGIGFTSKLAVIGVPGQPLAVGVMVKVTVTGPVVKLVSVPDMLPAPLADIPVTVIVLFLVQLYVVTVTLPDNTIVVIGVPEHIVCEDGVATALGVGLTSTVAVIDVPIQVTPAFV